MHHIHQLAIPRRLRFVALSGAREDINVALQLWPGLHALAINELFAAGSANDDLPPIRLPGGLSFLSGNAFYITQVLATAHDLPALRDLELVLVGPLPPAEVVEQLEQLESLVFDELPTEDVSLPKTLRHVGYHGSWTGGLPHDDASFLVAALRALDELKLVTVARSGLSAWVQAPLMDACRELHVEFVTFETLAHFPRPGHVDWI
ncbi:hypothetical protein FA95DRAFT_1575385 [Auriscalpium vulgare]|uniref:Uncharacterized protein n=1 Tax=Auriscalpium vulgare TaxID=40419 RepID=A0ACB8RGH6_9AGAM|nr:hypothetical protein FA95DRAFT_1575385 [Auriscalpium vulgare]